MVHIGWNKLVNINATPKARQGMGTTGPWLSPLVGQLPPMEHPGLNPRGPLGVAQLPSGAFPPRIDPNLVRAPWRPETGKQARDFASDACVGGLRNPNHPVASHRM